MTSLEYRFEDGRRGIVAAGGLIGALLASTCCIVPLVLVTLGISGAWIGNLTALAPYQWIFMAIATGFLVAGYWMVYFKQNTECEEGSYCASPASDRIMKIVLWTATVLIIGAISINLITPLLI